MFYAFNAYSAHATKKAKESDLGNAQQIMFLHGLHSAEIEMGVVVSW